MTSAKLFNQDLRKFRDHRKASTGDLQPPGAPQSVTPRKIPEAKEAIAAATGEQWLSFSALLKPCGNAYHSAESNSETYWRGIPSIVFLEFFPAGGEYLRGHDKAELLTDNLVYPGLSPMLQCPLTLLAQPTRSLLLVPPRLLTVQNSPQPNVWASPTTNMNATKVWQEYN